MYDKEIIKCINAAKMGLTQKETSDLLEIPYKLIQTLSNKYNIEFPCARRKANEKRRGNKIKSGEGDAKMPSFIEAYGRSSGTKQKIKLKAKTRRDTISFGNDSEEYHQRIIKELIKPVSSLEKKKEIAYAYRLHHFEVTQINNNKRPPFPKYKIHNIQSAETKSIREQRVRSMVKRKLIMDCFTKDRTMLAEDVALFTGENLRSSSQMLDLMFRDGKLNRERLQYTERKKDSVYIYSKP
jgi:hypothetical protein